MSPGDRWRGKQIDGATGRLLTQNAAPFRLLGGDYGK